MTDPNGAGRRPGRDLVLAHSSDLHIGGHSGPADLHILEAVVRTATLNTADALILAGDIFDHNRLPLAVLDRAARILGDADLPILILPGNHDCLGASSVYRRGGIGDPANVRVFGVTHDETIVIPDLELGLWGRPHNDYLDMAPLRNAPPRFARHQVAVAHGHWLEHQHDGHRSWLMTDDEISAVDADYIALGHWDRATIAGDGSAAAFYSGSPDLAKTLNLVRLDGGSPPDVSRVPIVWDGGVAEFRSPLRGGAHERPAE
ncbi:MAG: exonuclease SbcCD subunit D [Dehalococcoidia bacterium]